MVTVKYCNCFYLIYLFIQKRYVYVWMRIYVTANSLFHVIYTQFNKAFMGRESGKRNVHYSVCVREIERERVKALKPIHIQLWCQLKVFNQRDVLGHFAFLFLCLRFLHSLALICPLINYFCVCFSDTFTC